jgi:hypothetical protein
MKKYFLKKICQIFFFLPKGGKNTKKHQKFVADEDIFHSLHVTSTLEEMKSWSKLSRSKSDEDLVVLVQYVV